MWRKLDKFGNKSGWISWENSKCTLNFIQQLTYVYLAMKDNWIMGQVFKLFILQLFRVWGTCCCIERDVKWALWFVSWTSVSFSKRVNVVWTVLHIASVATDSALNKGIHELYTNKHYWEVKDLIWFRKFCHQTLSALVLINIHTASTTNQFPYSSGWNLTRDVNYKHFYVVTPLEIVKSWTYLGQILDKSWTYAP